MSTPETIVAAPYGTPWPDLDTWVNHLTITPDSEILAAACIDRTIRLWHLQNNESLTILQGHTNSVRCLAVVGSSNRLLSGADEGNIRIWDLNHPKETIKMWSGAHKGAVRSLTTSPDGKLALSTGDDGTIRLWDLVSTEPLENFYKHHQHPVSCAVFTSSGNLVVSGDENGQLCFWTREQSVLKLRSRFEIPRAVPITGMAALPGTDDVVTSCNDLTVRRWSATEGKSVGEPWRGHTDSVRSIGLLQDKILTGGGDSTLRLWDPATGSQIGDTWKGPMGSIETLAVAPNGKLVASAGANEMWSWFLSP